MSADMKQADVLELDNLTADEAAREIMQCMNRLARLQAVLVEWARNSEELLETVTVHAVEPEARCDCRGGGDRKGETQREPISTPRERTPYPVRRPTMEGLPNLSSPA